MAIEPIVHALIRIVAVSGPSSIRLLLLLLNSSRCLIKTMTSSLLMEIRSRKRRAVNAGRRGYIPMVVDLMEGNFVLWETTIIHIGESTGMDSEAPQSEEVNMDVLMRPEGEAIVEGASDGVHILPRQEEDSS